MKTILAMIVAPLLCCCGPDMGGSETYNSSVINNSGVLVEVIPYSDGIFRKDKKVIINDAQKINKVYTFHRGGLLRMIVVLFPDIRVNKIDIIFNGTKKITYEDCSPTNNCTIQPRNIFNNEFENERTEIYTITAEDFQNATDCGGNCN